MKLATILLVILLASCTQTGHYTSARIKPTHFPTDIPATPIPKDPCYYRLNPMMQEYLEGKEVNIEEMFAEAKTCKNPRVYASLQFGVRLKDPEVVRRLIK